MPYTIREAAPNDADAVVQIYNSNPLFLTRHLGRNRVNRAFIRNEQAAMKTAGFLSCVILDERAHKIVGVLDYRPGETVYLSLLMLDKKIQGGGVGRRVVRLFEDEMRTQNRRAIRMDVVDTYAGSALDFWKKQGFAAEQRIQLKWDEKESSAVVMKKTIWKSGQA